ncbi:MAG: sulfatase-like hydrolase/transferase, partial [Actinobacteria bacterium]|nr:sulfatase-like hydrolase/transferase [Actinomycetota bacterium]
MSRGKNDEVNVLDFSRGLLNRRDWVYLLSLLVPFVVYSLTLKALDIASLPGDDHGLARTLDLMLSDVFFDLGYALLWIGFFATARKGPLRKAVVVIFHAMTMIVLIVLTCAHQYFRQTGTTLDYGTIAEWLPKLNEIQPILLKGGVSIWAWVLLFLALLYTLLGPWLVTSAVGWWQRWPGRFQAGTSKVSLASFIGLWLLALGFGSLSLLVSSSLAGANTSLARGPFVNVVLTGVQEATARDDYGDAGPAVEFPAADAGLVQTPSTQKRNVVLIHLESTRERSVTPYNEDLNTTPFLDELAKKSSLLAERAYVVVPRSSKASVAVNCGVDPPLYQGPEFEPGGLPSPCLAGLLGDQGYSTAFFQSSSETMDQYSTM